MRSCLPVGSVVLCVPPPSSTWKSGPTSSQIGDSGANEQVLWNTAGSGAGPSISRGRGNHKCLESDPLIQTFLHSWGLSKCPINKKWQLAGFLNQRPCTAPSPHHFCSVSVHLLLISIFTFHYPPVWALSLPPPFPPSSRLPWKTHFYLAQKINSDCG